ncbi:MAG: hypothetical protein ACPL6C_03625 [bacterium]
MVKRVLFMIVLFLIVGNIEALGKKTRQKMDDDRFVALYIKLAKATEENLADSSALAAEQKKIFEESGFTKKDFEAYMKELDKEPERWAKIWEKISNELEKEKSAKEDSTKNLNVLPEPTVPPSLQKR